MKARISTNGSAIAVAIVVGMLTALSVQASNAVIKVTHSNTPYPIAVQAVAKAPATTAEVQIAVLAKTPSPPAAARPLHVNR